MKKIFLVYQYFEKIYKDYNNYKIYIKFLD